MARPLIALDADGVLLDFHLGYAGAWARAFGSRAGRARPARLLADRPLGGRSARRRAARSTSGATSTSSSGRRCRPSKAPSTPATASTTPATTWSASRRSTLEHEAARLRNLRDHGFPIERVIATGNAAGRAQPEGRRHRRRSARRPSSTTTCPTCAAFRATSTPRWSCARRTAARTKASSCRWRKSVHDDLPGFADFWLRR